MTMTIVCTRVVNFIVKTDTMSSKPSKSSKSSVGIENFQGRLRLRLPRQLYSGKQKYLTLELVDTKYNFMRCRQVRAGEAWGELLLSPVSCLLKCL